MDRVRRIAVAAALVTCAAIALPAGAAAATRIGVEDDFFSPQRATITVGESDVEWTWDLDGSSGGGTENPHDVVSREGLFSSQLTSSGTYARRASAGSFPYFCSIHAGMTGKLRVKPRVRVDGDGVRVRWAERGSNTGSRFDVQYRSEDAVGGGWDNLRRNDKAKSTSIRYADPDHPSTVWVRARSQRGRGSDRQSGWSPVVRADPR